MIKRILYLIFALTLTLLTWGCGGEPNVQPQNMNPAPPVGYPVLTERMTQEFRENRTAAAAKYANQQVLVSGKLTAAGDGKNNKISLKSAGLAPVEVSFSESEKKKILSLPADAATSLLCQMKEGNGSSPIALTDCTIQ